MTQVERMKHLGDELSAYIDRMCMEYELTLAEMVGVLEVGKQMTLNKYLSELDND